MLAMPPLLVIVFAILTGMFTVAGFEFLEKTNHVIELALGMVFVAAISVSNFTTQQAVARSQPCSVDHCDFGPIAPETPTPTFNIDEELKELGLFILGVGPGAGAGYLIRRARGRKGE